MFLLVGCLTLAEITSFQSAFNAVLNPLIPSLYKAKDSDIVSSEGAFPR